MTSAHKQWISAALALALVIGLPFFIYPVFLMKVFVFALLATAFNLLFGYVGLLSFGHAAFFGSSAYVTAYALKIWGLDPALALLVGVAAATALGFVIGALSIQSQGIYFSMVTLAFAQLIYFLALQAPFTGGEDGIQGVPRKALFGILNLDSPWSIYIFVAVLSALGLALLYRIVHSPFGLSLKAIRENETRAIALGYPVKTYKRRAFVLSAALAGLAGSLNVFVVQIASLSDVHWHLSGEIILMALLGGAFVFWGPLVGAFIIVMLQNGLAEASDWIPVIQGALFILCALAFRNGILGVFSKTKDN